MKSSIKLFCVIVILSLSISGCDKVDDLNTVDFDADFSADINCTTAGKKSTLNNPVFSASALIDPASDPNVNIYLTNIKAYEIQAVHATITSMSQENVTIITGDLIIHNFEHDAAWNFQNELLTTGKTLTFGNENGQWDTVADIFKAGQEITIIATGEADFSGVTFTIKIDIETKVTANII